MKSKLSEKEPFQNSENIQHFKTPVLVSLSQFMRVNEKYPHRPEPICSRYLIQRYLKIKGILGATGTWNVDGDYELPSINSILFEFFFPMTKRK